MDKDPNDNIKEQFTEAEYLDKKINGTLKTA
jgi:hypothetical protein